MQTALLLLTVVIGWGSYHNLAKYSSNTLSPPAIPLIGALVNIIFIPLYCWMLHKAPIKFTWQGVSWAVLAYCCSILGTLAYTFVLSKNDVSKVVGIATSYPIWTMLIAVMVMKEPLTLQKGLGLLLVVGGVIVSSR